MLHLPGLIHDLALILIAAGVVTLLFRKLKQPVVLGYILSGVLVGPNTSFFPTIVDLKSIQVWAEIGVIFLLFGLGLEFSFKKLVRVGGPASITAFVEAASMVAIGFLTGHFFGWNVIDSIFLGGVLAISSTTIIIRAFDELGVKSRGFVGLVFGVLVIEDIIAILLLVMLSTVAISQTVSGTDLVAAVAKLGFFLTLWFVGGIFFLPTILKRVANLMSEETLLVVALGLCFSMVIVATKAGFSPALGAFVMGSLLAETTHGHQIEKLLHPVKDLFAAIFFVSVGMLIDPKMLVEHAGPVLVITLVTIVGKTVSTTLGALLSGQSMKRSIQSGMSLAQIGEFSFIIAGLGQTLKVTSDFLYPIAVGVSALTTFTTPYMIRSSDAVVALAERKVPKRWQAILADYSNATKKLGATGEMGQAIRASLLRSAMHAVLITAIFRIIDTYVSPPLTDQLAGDSQLADILSLLLALFVSAPFFWALLRGGGRLRVIAKSGAGGRQDQAILMVLTGGRWVLAFLLGAVLSLHFAEPEVAFSIWAGAALVLLLGFWRYIGAIYARLERRFLTNLSEKERSEEKQNISELAPWDAHLTELTILPDSSLVGKTLADAAIREQFGVTLAFIERGKRKIAAPNRHERLYPHDRVAVIGSDEQIAAFRAAAENDGKVHEDSPLEHYALRPLTVTAESPFCGRTIRESGIREKFQGLVVGIERAGERILNPDSQIAIQTGDLLWIVGDVHRMQSE